jgi:hypothetical protein
LYLLRIVDLLNWDLLAYKAVLLLVHKIKLRLIQLVHVDTRLLKLNPRKLLKLFQQKHTFYLGFVQSPSGSLKTISSQANSTCSKQVGQASAIMNY